MKKILIIGGAGYIGNSVYVHLKSLNKYKISILDIGWFGNYTDVFVGNFDYNKTEDFSEYDVVILLAGMSSVAMSKNLTDTFKNNVRNFVNLLSKLQEGQKLIYASSSSVYGNTNISIHHEDEIEYRAGNAYDTSKHEIDLLAGLSDIEYYSMRLGTVNGPSPQFRRDVMLNKMYYDARKEGIIRISHGQIRRPVIGTSDLNRAVVTMIEKGDYKKRGIYNLASTNTIIENFALQASIYLDAKLEILSDIGKPYDFAISTDKFKETFNFQFQENIQSILKSIKEADEAKIIQNWGHRNDVIKYE